MQTKKCTGKCKSRKPVGEFERSSTTVDGRKNKCKSCTEVTRFEQKQRSMFSKKNKGDESIKKCNRGEHYYRAFIYRKVQGEKKKVPQRCPICFA